MALQIYDTMTRELRPFVPLTPGKVRMYVCGVTVYDLSHVGHARAYTAFDVVLRWLRHSGYDVTYARNFTDVDDKIIRRAHERGVSTEEITEKFIDAFHADMDMLGLLPPTMEPRATDHIEEMIDIIRALIDRGHAYVSGNDVYFSVPSYAAYGKLSRRKLEDLRAGTRELAAATTGAVVEEKRDPTDFALWKGAKPGEPHWESPWGEGRPGWHIECSAMAKKYLGQPFDIHGGGEDLVFPHHENEIAQSEAATGLEFSRYWMHNAFVRMNSEKMSKSLGNIVNLRDVFTKHPPEAFRIFALSAHYRSPLDFTDDAMREAEDRLERLYKAMDETTRKLATHMNRTIEFGPPNEAGEAQALLETMEARFTAAMDDDFNTAEALSVLFEIARQLNKLTSRPTINSGDWELAEKLRYGLKSLGGLIGLLTDDPAHWLEQRRIAGLGETGLTEAMIQEKIAERESARKRRDFKAADGVRDWLKERGIILEDTPAGTTWNKA